MKTIVVILKAPNADSTNERNEWNAMLHRIRQDLATTKPISDAEEPNEGSFVIRGSGGLRVLGAILFHASQAKISYRVFFIETGTEWSHEPVV